jgi:hypothetical protein
MPTPESNSVQLAPSVAESARSKSSVTAIRL